MCDDIRRELGNKMSFIGVYGDKMAVKKLPETLRAIHLYQRWILASGEYLAKAELRTPSGKDLVSQENEDKISVAADETTIHYVAVGSPLKLEEAGKYTDKVTLKSGGQEASGIHTIEVVEKSESETPTPSTNP